MQHPYFTEDDPLPGPNCFQTPAGIIVGHYPRRTKHSVPGALPGAILPAGGAGQKSNTSGAAAGGGPSQAHGTSQSGPHGGGRHGTARSSGRAGHNRHEARGGSRKRKADGHGK